MIITRHEGANAVPYLDMAPGVGSKGQMPKNAISPHFKMNLYIYNQCWGTHERYNDFLSPAFRRKRGNINLGLSLCLSLCLSVRLSRFGFRALTALKIVRFHPNSVCKYTRTIVRLSSKANAIRAYLRILIRLLNSHCLIGFRALTALINNT